MLGQRFGRLVVVRQTERPQGRKTEGKWYECQCDCGTTYLASYSALKHHFTQSCGCLRREKASARLQSMRQSGVIRPLLPLEEVAMRHRVYVYAKAARNRGHAFELTKEQCRALLLGDCFYCGAPPRTSLRVVGKHRGVVPQKVNGIDRKDNDLGYTVDNSVSCCAVCNHMKHTLSVDEFIAHIQRIAEHQRKR